MGFTDKLFKECAARTCAELRCDACDAVIQVADVMQPATLSSISSQCCRHSEASTDRKVANRCASYILAARATHTAMAVADSRRPNTTTTCYVCSFGPAPAEPPEVAVSAGCLILPP